MRFTYIGGPTALIEIGGWRLLTDPTFDPPGRRYFMGWGTVSTKVQGPALTPDRLGAIDAVLLSHDHHSDNLDVAGRELLARVDTVVTTAAGARRLGAGAQGLEPWATTRLEAPGKPTLEITATPCRHGFPGSGPIVGDVIGFALKWDAQANGQVWISGDTVLYPGVREVASRLDVGTAIVNLGSVKFWWLSGPLRYTLNAEEAATLCAQIDPKTIVPLHAEGWTHFRQSKAEAERVLAASAVGDRVVWPPAGEAIELEA